MIASSNSSENYAAHMGRLNFNGSWSAAVNDRNQYLGIDLGEDFTVTGIETQGSSDNATWVTKYTLQYGTASDHPNNYTEIIQGQEQMKVNSLNGYLSIIYVKKQKWYFIMLLSIFIRNLTCKAWHTTSVNDMINAHVLWLVELFGSLLQMLGAKLDKVS